MEAIFVFFSGTKRIQSKKQIEASKGLIKFSFFFRTDNVLSFLNLVTPMAEFRLGFKQVAIIAKEST